MAVQTAALYQNCYMVSFGNVKDVILAKIIEEQLSNTHVVTVLNSMRNRHVFMGKKYTQVPTKLKDANFMYKIFRRQKVIHVFWIYNLVSNRIGSFFIDNLIQYLVESKFSITGDTYIRKIEAPLFQGERTAAGKKNTESTNVADKHEGTLLMCHSPKSKKNVQNRKLEEDVEPVTDKVNRTAITSLQEVEQVRSDEVKIPISGDMEFDSSDIKQDAEFAEIRKLSHSTAKENEAQAILDPLDHFTCTKLECSPPLPAVADEAQKPAVPALLHCRMSEDAQVSSSETKQNLQPVQPMIPASRETEAQQKEESLTDSIFFTAVMNDDNCNPQTAQSNESNVSLLTEDMSDVSQNSERNEIDVLKYAFSVLTICAIRSKTEMFHLPRATASSSLNASNKAWSDTEEKNTEQSDDQNVSTESTYKENEDNVSSQSNVNWTSAYEFENPSPENQGSMRNSRNYMQAVITKSKEINARSAVDESYSFNEGPTNAETYNEQRTKYSSSEVDIGTRSWAKQRSYTTTPSLSAGHDSTIEIRVDHSKLPYPNSDKRKMDKKQRYTCKELIQPARKRPLCGNGSSRIDPLQLLKVRTVKPISKDDTMVKKKRTYKRRQEKIENIHHTDDITDCPPKETQETVEQEKVGEEKNKTRDCSVKLVPLEKLIMQDMRCKN